jgi:hypothetical protein
MKVFLPDEGNKFPRVVVEDDSSDLLSVAAEQAVMMADRHNLPVHIQNREQFTHLIIYPEGR